MTTSSTPTRLVLTAAALGLGLALTACSGSGSSAGAAAPGGSTGSGASAGGSTGGGSTAGSSPSGGSSSGGSSSAGSSSGGSSSAGSTGGGSTKPAVPVCADGQVTVTAGRSNGAAGHIGAPLVFHNTSATACTLYGFPGVAGLDSHGKQVVQAQRVTHGYMGSSILTTVLLAPGAAASALVVGVDVPNGDIASCPTFPALLVTPPGSHTSTKVALSMPGCPTLQVSPVVTGTKGGLS